MVGTSVSLSSSSDVNVTTGPFMYARPAVVPLMERQAAIFIRNSKPLHPFNLSKFQLLLCDTFLALKYPTIINSFSTGFLVGVLPISRTFSPPNSSSLQTLYSEFVSIVNKEFELTRYLGPFSQNELTQLLGHFQTSPLSLVPKPNSQKYRLIQNLSFPHSNRPVPSVNSSINSSHFPCSFGTFHTLCLIINMLPPGSQASTRDVSDAYRTVPLHPSQWPALVVKLGHDSFAINTQNSFGLASAGGVWGLVADFLGDLFRSQGIGPLSKWVDDYIFFRIPSQYLPDLNCYRAQLASQLSRCQTNARSYYAGPPLPDLSPSQYDEDFHFPLSSHSDPFYSYTDTDIDEFSQAIGLPWKESKTAPFSHLATYLGFIWNLNLRTVSLHPNKQKKYLLAIQEWLTRPSHTLLQVQSLYGKLLHTTYIIPAGRLYLTNFERMIPTFHSRPYCPHRPPKQLKTDLIWWSRILSLPELTRDIPSFQAYATLPAFSDASNQAIGIVYHTSSAIFAYSHNFQQRSRNIAWAEAVAVYFLLLVLDCFPLNNSRITLHCDNRVVADGWKIGRSRNSFVNDIFKNIHEHISKRNTQLHLEYVPSHLNPADAPSRGISLSGTPLPYFQLPPPFQNDFHRVDEPHTYNFHAKLRPVHSKLLPAPPSDNYHASPGEFPF